MMFESKPEVNIKYSDEAKNTLSCIFEVQQQVTVEEGGENRQGGRYNYARLPDMQTAILPTLSKYRCVYLVGTDQASVHSEYTKLQGKNDPTPKDKLVTFSFWSGCITLVCIDNPKDWVKVSGFGFKVDQISDKSLGAETVGKRYLLAKLFGFVTGDDPDDNESDVRRHDIVDSVNNPQPSPARRGTSTTSISQFLS